MAELSKPKCPDRYKPFIKLVQEGASISTADLPRFNIKDSGVLIEYVLYDSKLTPLYRTESLKILLNCISNEIKHSNDKTSEFSDLISKLTIPQVDSLVQLVATDKMLNQHDFFVNECFELWLNRILKDDGLLRTEKNQASINLLRVLIPKTQLKELNALDFAITIMKEDGVSKKTYTNTLHNIIIRLYTNSLIQLQKNPNDRELRNKLSITLSKLARFSEGIFVRCLEGSIKSLEQHYVDGKEEQIKLLMVDLIPYQINYVLTMCQERKLFCANIAQKKFNQAEKVMKEITVLLDKIWQNRGRVQELAKLAGIFAERMHDKYIIPTNIETLKEAVWLLEKESDRISGAAAIRKKNYVISCSVISIMLLGAGGGLFSPRGMKFLHTTPAEFAGYFATIGPGSFITMASFIFELLRRRKFFSNSITRAIHDFFTDGGFLSCFSDIDDYATKDRIETLNSRITPTASPVKGGSNYSLS